MGQGENLEPGRFNGRPKRPRAVRPGFSAVILLFALLAAIVAIKLTRHTQAAIPARTVVAVAAPAPVPAAKVEPVSIPTTPIVRAVPMVKAPAAVKETPLVSPKLLTPQQLTDELAKIGKGPITAEMAARFKADLKELVRRGAASVPAIQALLQENFDESFGSVKGGDQLGYSGLRSSLIDTLNQIGGTAAQAALVQTMDTTAVPAELLEIAQDLDKQAPGQYTDEIASNAQVTLAMASEGQLATNSELGPAFRALQNYGTPGTTADAAAADPLDFYNAVQLANMPDGQGLTSLLQMEQSSSGDSQFIATAMIAQMAGQNGDALDALAQLAQNGQISQNEWVQLAPILAGDQYQMNASGQDYTVVPGATTTGKIQQRIEMLETFMSFVPDGTGGAKAMQQQLTTLRGEL